MTFDEEFRLCYGKTDDNLIKLFKLIEFRRKNPLTFVQSTYRKPGYIYCERHHIVPKCFYTRLGLEVNNSDENIICLLAVEHLDIHVIMRDYFKNYDKGMYEAMVHAISRMLHGNPESINEILKSDESRTKYQEEKQKSLAEYSKVVSFQMSERAKTHTYMYKIMPYKRIFIDRNKIESYAKRGWLTHDEYVLGRTKMLFEAFMSAETLELGLESIKSLGFNGTPTTFRSICIQILDLDDNARNALSLKISGKKMKRMFSTEEKEYMRTHSYEECLQHFNNLTTYAIRNRMTRQGLRSPSLIYSNEQSDKIIRENSIKDAAKLLNWPESKVICRRYKLRILVDTRIPYTKDDDDLIMSVSIADAAKALGRTKTAIKRRRYVLKQKKAGLDEKTDV